jgi:AcrR family transcriptional regulator
MPAVTYLSIHFNRIVNVAAAKKKKRPPEPDAEQRILGAARRVFIRRGTAGARMQEIAEEAGVNQALLHYYFRSKDRLAERVFVDAAAQLFSALAPAVSADAPIEVLVEQFVHHYIDIVRQHPFIPGYIVSELHHHPERAPELLARVTGSASGAIARAALEGFRAKYAAKVRAGELRAVDPPQFLVSMVGTVVFPFLARPVLCAAMRLDETGFDRFLDERRALLPGLLLNALRP